MQNVFDLILGEVLSVSTNVQRPASPEEVWTTPGDRSRHSPNSPQSTLHPSTLGTSLGDGPATPCSPPSLRPALGAGPEGPVCSCHLQLSLQVCQARLSSQPGLAAQPGVSLD